MCKQSSNSRSISQKPRREALTKETQPLIGLLEKQKVACQRAYEYYKKIEANTSPDGEYGILKNEKPALDLEDIVSSQMRKPTEILENALVTLEEYIETLTKLTPDQFAAFVLGLGLKWIPFEYWGMRALSLLLKRTG